MRRKNGYSLAFIVVSILVLISLVAFGAHYLSRHTVEPDQLDKLSVGMDWSEAKEIIGTDQSPIKQSDGTYFVAVRKYDRWCMVDLTLDSRLRITSVFHDH